MDIATAPQIIPPPSCWQTQDAGTVVFELDSPPDPADVGVEDLPQVGAFEPQVISPDDPAALENWLNENDSHIITPVMEPYVAQYVAEGYKLKLHCSARMKLQKFRL
ncbi:MAG: DUF2330 domain-containing protein [Deltaproteobacteria bacterium]|nr:DUF2330 domain-containing protein [Deltaproteobacteria bacterium]